MLRFSSKSANRGFNWLTGLASRRSIHLASDLPAGTKEVVVVGHNSAMFASLESLRYHRERGQRYPKVTHVHPPFWLDRVHPDHLNFHWGQTIYGLPKAARRVFLKQRPHYPEDAYIRWGEFQDTRYAALKELENEYDVTVHQVQPEEIAEQNDRWVLRATNGLEISFPMESFIYGWYRTPKLPEIIHRPHVDLYTLPRNEVPDEFIVVGHGLSLVWLLKHFPNSKIYNYKLPYDELPIIPSNMDINIKEEIRKGRLVLCTLADFKLEVVDGVQGALTSRKTDKPAHRSTLPIYAATGFLPQVALFKNIPDEQKVLMPDYDEQGRLKLPNDSETLRLDQDAFVAAQNLPMGSLPQSYTYLMNLTRNIEWTTEPMFYYRRSQYELVKKAAHDVGIDIDLSFFDDLDERVQAMANPLNPERAQKLYCEVFERVYKPTDIERRKFTGCIEKLFPVNGVSIDGDVVQQPKQRRR